MFMKAITPGAVGGVTHGTTPMRLHYYRNPLGSVAVPTPSVAAGRRLRVATASAATALAAEPPLPKHRSRPAIHPQSSRHGARLKLSAVAGNEAGEGREVKGDSSVIRQVLMFAVAMGAAVAAGALLPLPSWAKALPELLVGLMFRAQIWRATRPLREAVSTACERALRKWNTQRRAALIIPFVSAFVGWLTNWVAVQMIFYPIEFWGLPLQRWVIGSLYDCSILQPLGLIGWQGIVPAKAAQMSYNMVEMVTTKLINVQEVFGRLDPGEVARLLREEMPKLAADAGRAVIPEAYVGMAAERAAGLPAFLRAVATSVQDDYVRGLVEAVQRNTHAVVDLKELVVKEMWSDKNIIVTFFQNCGQAELRFLVVSGVYFGFLLGLIQMVVWLFCDASWLLTAGGMIVGYLTNWLALKCIFEPLHPVQWGPFVFQGIFLQRQYEVSCEFARFLASEVLVSSKIWGNMLFGGRAGEFQELTREHTKDFVEQLQPRLAEAGSEQFINEVADSALQELPSHIHPLHGYIDSTLQLRTLMEEKLRLMTPEQFERVLHPIFEEDELTLILAGAVLGGIAGYGQQWLDERDRAAKAAAAVRANDLAWAAAERTLPPPQLNDYNKDDRARDEEPTSPVTSVDDGARSKVPGGGSEEQAASGRSSVDGESSSGVTGDIDDDVETVASDDTGVREAVLPSATDSAVASSPPDQPLEAADKEGGREEVSPPVSTPIVDTSGKRDEAGTIGMGGGDAVVGQVVAVAEEGEDESEWEPTAEQRRLMGYLVFVLLPLVLSAFAI